MNEQEKQQYLDSYKKAKEKGKFFYPDILFKDAVVSLLVFIFLIGLAYFLGAPLEERANPADTTYTPRPEWYFLFLFQLLKYFPGSLEVVGVVLIPTLAIVLLFLLPFLDRKASRHFSRRPVVIATTSVVIVGIILLTIQSVRETPPPAEAAEGDPAAALYAKNCAGCHGSFIHVAQGTNLYEIIAQGKHEGMPAWGADLTNDQIDLLAGFILSPGGSRLFADQCGACHESTDLVVGESQKLKEALNTGKAFEPHAEVDIPDWQKTLSAEERTALLNFLVAPDGQRLFATDCSPCHGKSVSYAGTEAELRSIISQGGLHLDMPPWQETLSSTELDALANYVIAPSAHPEGVQLFAANCVSCHGERAPSGTDFAETRQIIAEGGSHQTMPVWGEVLTDAQLDALVSYTLNAAKGTSLEAGQELFATNCSPCHGDFGEGGINPARPNDIIAPISTSEYLKTRDDITLRAIIAQGQPDFGMSPFGSSNGGPLDDDEVDAIVAFLRSWEANPPVELPPSIDVKQVSLNSAEIYQDLCTQCHGPKGEGGVGHALAGETFQQSRTDQDLYDVIDKGHPNTSMIGWGGILNSEQIQGLVQFIRQLEPLQPTPAAGEAPTPTPEASARPTFTVDVLPIFQAKCVMCHGSLGGWNASTYDEVMTSGNNAPVVILGDPDGSLLARKLLGTHTEGTIMPPGGKLPESELQTILDWIAAGALK